LSISANLAKRISSRSACLNREFRAIHQLEIIAALDEDRSGPDTGTDCGANRRTLATAGYGPNHGTDRSANAGARHRASSLVTLILNPSLVVDPDGVIVRRPDAFNVPGGCGSHCEHLRGISAAG
jgi:hypothetical protein